MYKLTVEINCNLLLKYFVSGYHMIKPSSVQCMQIAEDNKNG